MERAPNFDPDSDLNRLIWPKKIEIFGGTGCMEVQNASFNLIG